MTTDPTTEPLRFAYWVPNVSGGLVTSTIEQRTDWSFAYNRKLARLAERAGFDYALSQVRYTASYGAEYQHESTSFSLALLLATERLKLIAAVHPGLWHPGVLAKWVATADHLSGGRVAVNVVSGWFADEFRQLGEPWLEHDERYRRTAEFITALKRIWTEDEANLAGDFYRIRDFSLKPKPLSWPGRPHPEIFQGGNSTAARRNGGQLSDWYFSNGKDFDGVREQLAELRQNADAVGPHRRAPVRPERVRHRPRHRARGQGAAARDHRQGARRGGRGLRRRGQAGRAVHRRQEGHVGRLVVRGPGPVQRRLPHQAHRHGRAGGGADRRVPQAGRRPHPDRLPALPRGDRAVRQARCCRSSASSRCRPGWTRPRCPIRPRA